MSNITDKRARAILGDEYNAARRSGASRLADGSLVRWTGARWILFSDVVYS